MLTVCTRNLTRKSGALSLIHKRSLSLRSDYDLDTKFILLTSAEKYNNGAAELSQDGFELVNVTYNSKMSLIMSFWYLYLKIRLHMKKETRNNCILITGYFPIIFVKLLRLEFKNWKFVNDVHGAPEEFIEYPGNQKYIRRIKYYVWSRHLKWIGKVFDGVFIVSSAMQELLERKYFFSKSKVCYFQVPCIDNYDVRGTEARTATFSVNDNESIKLFYAGSDAPWQNIDTMLELHKYLNENYTFGSTLYLVISNQSYDLNNQVLDNVVLHKNLSREEVFAVAGNANYGLLLRDKDVTNWVSYPNKIYDYLVAGLDLIFTDGISELNSIHRRYQLGCRLEANWPIEKMATAIISYHQRNKKFHPEKLLSELNMKNALVKFVQYSRGEEK